MDEHNMSKINMQEARLYNNMVTSIIKTVIPDNHLYSRVTTDHPQGDYENGM